jgi:high-affinity nickel-transport protein
VVFVLSLLLALGIRGLGAQLRSGGSSLHSVTTLVGTAVSGAFLYLIAALNLAVLASLARMFLQMRSGVYDEAQMEEQLAKRGLMNRLLGSLNRRVDEPWKMYPIGVLFGLGFDTVTEIAFLVLAGSAVVSGLPFYAVLSLPILFAAGMSLFDTADGCFMNFAYDWAFSRPVRKLYYNLTITGLSVLVAFFIGTIEILGLISHEAKLSGGFWTFMANFNLNTAGFAIVGMFAVTWAVALAIWRFGQIERKLDAAMAASSQSGG